MKTAEFETLLSELSPNEQYKLLYSAMYKVCEDNEWGDPFSYARSKEIRMSIEFGHCIGKTYSGEDAYIIEDGVKKKFEYKSTIDNAVKGVYNGISVKPTLEEQIDYITNDKIGCYDTHYFSRFANGEIAETWAIPGSKMVEILLPKVVKQYKSTTKKADPRIGVSISHREITKNGVRIQ
jgi:hypothetical protein